MRILIVEDDILLAESISAFFRQAGYEVDCESSGAGADSALSQASYDLTILDIGLSGIPGMDGFGVLHRLRQRGQQLPVLIYTARDDVEDRVHGLTLGADDYVLKPLQLQELEARVRALLRRTQDRRNGTLSYGPLILVRDPHQAWLGLEMLNLTAPEWQVLECLVLRAGTVVSREELGDASSQSEETISPNTIELHISHLRAKLEAAEVKIRTVRGLGYLLDVPVDKRH
jgi:DNA-binding response OmpR family regulator